jgi:pyruvate dehydrogenase E2 component (dihydrolipoamide acetyltransferase)/2-oxoglutarate dehydrogenase E2 component (dihydrolipoamide succinyltransferase)
MAEIMPMPKLAKAMKRGKIVEWKAEEGEWVEKGQVVLIIETEKVSLECESPASGYLHIIGEFDNIYPVEETIALVAETKAELRELQASQPAPQGPGDRKGQAASGSRTNKPSIASKKMGRAKISPAAKNLAKKHEVDIARITGSGPGGRIKKEDVVKYMQSGKTAISAGAPADAWTGETVEGKRVKAVIPFRGMRKSIADHMMQSLSASAQLSNMGEIDMTELVRLRKSYLAKEEEIGVRITYTDMIVMLLSKAVQGVPIVNSSIVGDDIKIWEDINVGVAVSVESGEYDTGLLVPVIKNTEKKSLAEISRAIGDLTIRARNGELTPDDLTDGTLTLTNVGGLTSGWFIGTPIINQPQAVIVGTGGILQKPVGVNGKVELRPIMTISFTYDHRVLDGAPIAKFYSKIIELAANPEYLLL